MSMVGIYGYMCVWWDLSTWWNTGMGIGGTQVIVVDSDSVMSYTQNIREQTLHSKGYRWTRCRRVNKWGMNKGLKNSIKKGKRGREASR